MVLLAVVIALIQTRGAWGSRPPGGQDTMALLLRTHFGIDQLWGHFHLDGWMPNFAMGYQEFLFYGPGQTLAVGVAHVATLGLLSVDGSYKVVTVLSFAIFPVSVCWLARSLGLTRGAAGAAALLSLLVDNPYGVGLKAIFQNSLVAQQLAASLAFFAIGGFCRLLTGPSRRLVLGTAVACALLIITHIITTVAALLLALIVCPTLLFSDRPKLRAVLAVVLAGAIGCGLAGWWLLPALVHHNLGGAVATWATPSLPSRLHSIWDGTYLLRPGIAKLAVIGWLYGLYRVTRNRRWSVAVLFAPIVFVLVGRALLHHYPHNNLMIQFENRTIGLVAVLALFPLAAGIDAVAALLFRSAFRSAEAVLAGIVSATLVALTTGPLGSFVQQMPTPAAALSAAAVELHRIVPPGERWVEVREFPQEQDATGLVHPDFWLAEQSGRWTADEFNPESSTPIEPTFVSYHLLDHPAATDAQTLIRLDVPFVVTTTPISYRYLTASPLFHPLWSSGGVSILQVREPADTPAAARSPLTTLAVPTPRLVHVSTDKLDLEISQRAPSRVTIAVAWSPEWHARVDGRAAALGRSPDGLMSVALPAGRHAVSLDFQPDSWAWLGEVCTLATIAALIVFWRRPGSAFPGRARRR
jgi:hypothetical protein